MSCSPRMRASAGLNRMGVPSGSPAAIFESSLIHLPEDRGPEAGIDDATRGRGRSRALLPGPPGALAGGCAPPASPGALAGPDLEHQRGRRGVRRARP